MEGFEIHRIAERDLALEKMQHDTGADQFFLVQAVAVLDFTQ